MRGQNCKATRSLHNGFFPEKESSVENKLNEKLRGCTGASANHKTKTTEEFGRQVPLCYAEAAAREQEGNQVKISAKVREQGFRWARGRAASRLVRLAHTRGS